MSNRIRTLEFGFAICVATVLSAGAVQAGTILHLDLGTDQGPDVGFNSTTLGTVPDSNVATLGDQDTAIDFSDLLGGIPDVASPSASFSLNGLTVTGTATVFGGTLVVQEFSGGTLDVYDPGNALLLSGSLAPSTLTGTIGSPGTGALFTATFGAFTGGSLLPFLDVNTLMMSLTLFNVNSGGGLSVSGDQLNGFEAGAGVAIAAQPVPEPATAWLLLMGVAALTRVRSSRS